MVSLELILKDIDSKDSKYKWYSMTLNDEMCNIEKPNSVIIGTIANISPSDSSKLNPTKDTKFSIIGDIGQEEFDEIKSVAMRRGLPFNEVLDYVRKSGGSGFDTKVMEVKVMDVVRRESGATVLMGEIKDRTISDMEKLFDEETGNLKDNSFYGRVPNTMPIKFGDGSKVLLFGNPDYASKREGNDWIKEKTKPFLWIRGVLVPKDQQIEEQSTDVSGAVSQDEINTTKWEKEKEDGGDMNGKQWKV